MTANGYKTRVSNDLTKKNDVICFDYINDLSPGYSAISFEKKYDDRESGYVEIIKKILRSINGEEKQSVIYYYNESPFTLEDTPINRYKGYWGLKAYTNKTYDFLSCRSEILLDLDGRFKMKGIAKLNENELRMLVNEVSYKEQSFLFYFRSENLDINNFIMETSSLNYSQIINCVLEKNGFVFILLGDEDIKTSEVVTIANPSEINNIQHRFQ
ncbi:hypothetical protein RI049_24715 [Cedecea neteri]|uniref:hypothetical protein n=1 Tax=Cedecea neteri TaxID=158822 RepID=UPI002AA957EA|nr:hypothetical protein [Cedecea neteri]WPU23152.1 hypothetical protein RI049_24715 [Cedecea neteri]